MKEQYHLVSFSGGKDSTAMLLGMLERDMKIDCILFCDTGLEFPAMYDHIAKVEKDIGRKITSVRAEHTYEELMFDVPVRRSADSPVVRKYGAQLNGYGWPGPRQRWCTTRLKAMPRERFLRELRKRYEVIEYVGIAADEQYRLERANNQNPNHRHPLVDWGWTERDCLRYCYERGYDWDGLYEHFKREQLRTTKAEREAQAEAIGAFMFEVQELDALTEFDEKLWLTIIDTITVHADGRMTFKFQGGTEIEA